MNARTRVVVLSWIAVAVFLVDVVIFARAAQGDERQEFELGEFLAEHGLNCPRDSDFQCSQLVDALEAHDKEPTPYDVPCAELRAGGRICVVSTPRSDADAIRDRNETAFRGP